MHDLGSRTDSESWSAFSRGPLWRRSAFRSAMSGWRDFVLRGCFSREAGRTERLVPRRICESHSRFRAN